MWFSINSYGDVEIVDSPDVAEQSANNCLADERSQAGDGWNEDVSRIMWGKVLGVTEETMRRPRTEDDYGIDASCNEVVDYGVVPVPLNHPATDLQWAIDELDRSRHNLIRMIRHEIARLAEENNLDRISFRSELYLVIKDGREVPMPSEMKKLFQTYLKKIDSSGFSARWMDGSGWS